MSGFGSRRQSWVVACFWIWTASALALVPAPPGEELPPLRPPRPEIPPGFWEQHGWWVVIGGIAALALLAAGIWLLRRPRPVAAVPPEQEARLALEPLRQRPEDGVVLSLVSQVLRHSFGRIFNLAPGESTTNEFCRELGERREQVGPELAENLSGFLRRCDEQKFAPGAAGGRLGAVPRALEFIDQAAARKAALDAAAARAAAEAGPGKAA